jgi:hypothetical protein
LEHGFPRNQFAVRPLGLIRIRLVYRIDAICPALYAGQAATVAPLASFAGYERGSGVSLWRTEKVCPEFQRVHAVAGVASGFSEAVLKRGASRNWAS